MKLRRLLTWKCLSSTFLSCALFTSSPAFSTLKEMKVKARRHMISLRLALRTWLIFISYYISSETVSSSAPEKMFTLPVNSCAVPIVSLAWLSLDKPVEVSLTGWIKYSVEINYFPTHVRWVFSLRTCLPLNKLSLLRGYLVPWCSNWCIFISFLLWGENSG